MSQENLKIINKIYDAFNRKDYEAVLDCFGKNFEWYAADHSPLAAGSPYRGTDAVRNGVFGPIAAGFEYLELKTDELFGADEERVVMLGYYEGVFKASGKPFRAQAAHIWTLADGRAVKFQQYVDTFQINESARQTAD